jgi:minimal PKS acyl carrier protein
VTFELTYPDLAMMLKSKAGITIDPDELARPGATFEEFGVDSLGLLGVVGELENRHRVSIASGAESAKTPAEFVDAVNSAVKAGA